ncbi:IS3 family transposase [Paraburkholderia phymatum]|uniref:IS3 family transposase n=1 Tax=Paraburkholderia phymatum TaxID=148447 RepID=A0ACC6U8B2_9BURK
MAKYTLQTKLSAVEDYCSGQSGLKVVANRHGVDVSSLRQWVASYRARGADGLHEKARSSYSVEFKLAVLQRMQDDELSYRQVAAVFDIRRFDIVGHWKRQYDNGGVEALSWGAAGRKRTMTKQLNQESKAHPRDDEKRSAARKAQVVLELRQEYPLADLLQIAGLARSTFYYQQKALQMADKYASLKDRIRFVFDQHKGRYGYRRVTAVIRQEGRRINHKTVQRLMGELQLKSCVRVKKYRAYRGQIGHVAPNVLERNFAAQRPNEKWVTDVTEFNVSGQKLYLSPIMDLYNGEIVAYETARRPLFNMVGSMLRKAFDRLGADERPILHSDQGWQYRMPDYRRHLENRKVTQSMSRKGNCLDNAAMESFFGTLKAEFYHVNEFSSIDELRAGVDDYIRYYNNDRIKLKLGGRSPVEYRIQFDQA